MDSRDFFRRFFGFPSRRPFAHDGEEPGDHLDGHSQGDPLFQWFFGESSRGLEGMFEHFHSDMRRQMDAMRRQMEDIEAGFGAIDFPSSFGQLPSLKPMEPPGQDNAGQNGQVFIWSNTPSPFFGPRGQQTTPRDFMLKDGMDLDHGVVGPPAGGGRAKDDSVSLVPRWNKQNKVDTDLDGKISDSKILDMIQKPIQGIQTDAPTDPSKQGYFSSSSKSVSVATFMGPNSKFEHKRTVRDSAGHEKSTVTRSLGDKSYTVTTVTGRDGMQERHETYKNMDEKDLSKFEEDWRRSQHPSPAAADNMMSPHTLPGPDPRIHPGLDPADMDLFTKLFDTRRH